MYQSYATQIYGYILPYGADKNVLTLVHGVSERRNVFRFLFQFFIIWLTDVLRSFLW